MTKEVKNINMHYYWRRLWDDGFTLKRYGRGWNNLLLRSGMAYRFEQSRRHTFI